VKKEAESDNFLMAYDILFYISVTHILLFCVRTYGSFMYLRHFEL
jgi:hypothetical protein